MAGGESRRLMRALLSEAPGGPETLVLRDDAPRPEPGPGEVLIEVRACALNYPDVLIIEDKYQYRPPRPFGPGAEVAGTVVALGKGVSGFAAGQRVMTRVPHSGLAEFALARADEVFALPDNVAFAPASALIFTYGTALYALDDRGRLRAGETLLVLGAAGGVGIASVEIGKALGARVVAAVSSEDKAAAAKEAGADETLVYARPPFDRDAARALAAQFKQAVGEPGADVVLDPVGGDYAEPALRALAWEGRYLVVGFPAGIPRLPLNLALLKNCDIRGVAWGAWAERDPAANRAMIGRLIEMMANGRVSPRVTATYPLERAAEAIARMAARETVGKLVVTIA